MTVQQAIERADQMRQGNTVPDELKLEWLSECEGYIWDESIKMHFGSHRYRRYKETEDENTGETIRVEIIPAWKYTEEDTDAELIAYAPYDMLYVYWLMAKIDLFSQEIDNYNASMSLFLNEKQQFKNHYHTHNKTIPNPQMRV